MYISKRKKEGFFGERVGLSKFAEIKWKVAQLGKREREKKADSALVPSPLSASVSDRDLSL